TSLRAIGASQRFDHLTPFARAHQSSQSLSCAKAKIVIALVGYSEISTDCFGKAPHFLKREDPQEGGLPANRSANDLRVDRHRGDSGEQLEGRFIIASCELNLRLAIQPHRSQRLPRKLLFDAM